MSDSVRVLLIDDESKEAERYAALLNRAGLKVEHRLPPPDMNVHALIDSATDLFLVDYELTAPRGEGQAASYRGWSLATELRQETNDRPIVLLTRTDLESWKRAKRNLEGSRIVDDVMFKTDITNDPGLIARRLTSFVDGYSTIRCQDATYQGLYLTLLPPSSEEHGRLSESAPPKPQWQPFEAAVWIRNVLLRYPGILYDAVHASTALGLSTESFALPDIRAAFDNARYKGVFGDLGEWWWRSQLFEMAEALRQDAEVPGVLNEAVPRALEKRLCVSLPGPVCVFSGQSPADWVCCVLESPVKYDFTLAYGIDNRPKSMDEARISFKAIIESQDVKLELFDKYSAEMAEDMQKFPGKYRRTL